MIEIKAAQRLRAYDSKWADKAQRDIDRKYQGQQPPADADDKIFNMQPSALARALKNRYKDDYQAAMGSLSFYINRAGKSFKSTDTNRLEKAKEELRKIYKREPKVEAASRLQAMRISKGDNFKAGRKTAQAFLEQEPDYPLEVLQVHKSQVLIAKPSKHSTYYMLATCDSERAAQALPKAVRKGSALNTLGVLSVDALIGVYLNAVNSIWVSEAIRGKGYGKALYKVAYRYSKRGISSSLFLGSMSLAVWISLIKEFPKKIYLDVIGYGKVKASDLEIKGLNILAPAYGLNLTSPKGPDFRIRWSK